MRYLKNIGIAFISIILLLTSVAYALFYYKKELIKEQIVDLVNERIHGKLIIGQVGLDLFSGLNRASIVVKDAILYETKEAYTLHEGMPVVQLNELRVSFNLLNLLNDKIKVEKIAVVGGQLDMVSYADGRFNLFYAFGQNEADTLAGDDKIEIDLQGIKFEDLELHHHLESSNLDLVTSVALFESDLDIIGDSVSGNILIDFWLDSLTVDGRHLLGQHSIFINTAFSSDLNKLAFNFSQGEIKFDLLTAELSGTYNYLDSGYVDIDIMANHSDLSELEKMELFNPEYLPDIREGNLTFSTKILGKTVGQLPTINAVANLNNLHIHNKFGEVIKESGFSFNFFSGTWPNMRDGLLYIHNVDLNFATGGYLSGELLVLDFAQPIYKINWQLEEDLADLSRIFRIPGINDLEGTISSQARLKGHFDLRNRKFDNPQGILRVQFDECDMVLSQTDYPIRKLNGQLFLKDDEITVDDLTVDANGNILKINSSTRNLLPYLLGMTTELSSKLALHTHSLKTAQLLAFDSTLQRKVDYQVDSIDLVVRGDFLSSDIDSFGLIPTGKLEIDNLTAKVTGIPLINKVKGQIIISPDTLQLNDFSGFVGTSPGNLNLQLTNYNGYFLPDTLQYMNLSVDFSSSELIASDFFTINNEFILPKSYEHEVLKDVAFKIGVGTSNKELHKQGLVPEFSFQITDLTFKTHYSPVKFSDIAAFGFISDNNIYINSLFGKFGHSDIFMNAEFNNVLPTKDTISRPLRSRISLNSQLLDLDELINLTDADHGHDTVAEDTTAAATNPYAYDYPVTDLHVNIGKLVYYGEEINMLSGVLKIEEQNVIKLEKVKLEAGEYGAFEFEGVFDASSHQEAILDSKVKVTNVDLSKLDLTYVQDGEEINVSDHLVGIFNGEFTATVPVLQDFSFDIDRLQGQVTAIVQNGALVNYGPLQELSRYFKNKDLSNVLFADLINTMIFNKGEIHLPYMTINTTLGTIFLMGYQNSDGDMEFDIEVPAKLIAGAVFNSIFAPNKEDDGKQDEISTGKKGKYVTIHVYTEDDEYRFKIGKKHGIDKEMPAEVMD